MLFGIPVPILGATGTSSSSAAASHGGRAFLYVPATVWTVRGLLLSPYWRFRQGSPQKTPAAGSLVPERHL